MCQMCHPSVNTHLHTKCTLLHYTLFHKGKKNFVQIRLDEIAQHPGVQITPITQQRINSIRTM